MKSKSSSASPDGVNPFAPPEGGWRRVIGRFKGQRPGPKVVFMASLHGNEPAGAVAIGRVLKDLHERQMPFAGDIVGFIGNLKALNADVRYLERDMNRMWTVDLIARAQQPHRSDGPQGPGSGIGAEWEELKEAQALLKMELDGSTQEAFLVDLHTSSADGVPFACVGDTIRNRRFTRALPIPILLGLEEQLDGALLEYLNNRGVVTMGLEGGQHREPHSIDRHEAGIWISLFSAGCFPGPVPEQVVQGRRLLSEARCNLPSVLEILHRHGLRNGEKFRMKPGYENFTKVTAEEVLATDRSGEIRAPLPGRIMLPLYQGKGEDGFFIAREIRPFWLRISVFLRIIKAYRLVKHWPGVSRHPNIPHTVIVNKKVARWYSIQLFHLLGYRKRRANKDLLVMTRRAFDQKKPDQIRI
ncbi:MAG: succinylglutamate desuccinylase/aspartoacylase family protein [Planctomycetes bacterium]|nr:succinylglutamate desuccinylase/aspartoacylase family protein [Planctomycetota bacterium]